MKTGKLSNFLGASLLTLSVASIPFASPVSAQVTTTDPVTPTAPTAVDYERDSFDWGWLGLLGLIGLAGLAGRNKHQEAARYREPDEVSRPGTRF